MQGIELIEQLHVILTGQACLLQLICWGIAVKNISLVDHDKQ